MAKDLKLVGLKYNIAAAVFFVSSGGLTWISVIYPWADRYLTASRKYSRMNSP